MNHTKFRVLFLVLIGMGLLTPLTITSAASSKLEIQSVLSGSKAGEVEISFKSLISGKPVNSYTVNAEPLNTELVSLKKLVKKRLIGYNNVTIAGLVSGEKYTFYITAKNNRGITYKSNEFETTLDPVAPSLPRITGAFATNSDEAIVEYQSPDFNGGSSILFYTAYSYPGNVSATVFQEGSGAIVIRGLEKSTKYTFKISATNIVGSSIMSESSDEIKTFDKKFIPITTISTTPAISAPAFTLSSTAETRVVTTPIAGYAINSTGGAISSYSLSGTLPAGLTFNTSTGLISGTPTETKTATVYTITATNASGSASNNFQLRVTGDIGDTGPGGGTIYYYSSVGFSCGPTRTSTCKYLEAAPAGWISNADTSTSRTWAQASLQSSAVFSDTSTIYSIGAGYQNTIAIINQGNSDSSTSAAALARSYTSTVSGTTFNDWFLPSKDELNQMCKWQANIYGVSASVVCNSDFTRVNTGIGASGFASGTYWTSSEYSALVPWTQIFTGGSQSAGSGKGATRYVRPSRAF